MSHQLIARSKDLLRLRNEGYEVEVRSGLLLVHSVPYINSLCEVKLGTLVSELTLAGEVTGPPSTHIAFFIGDFPCTKEGKEIVQIKLEIAQKPIVNGTPVNHAFSNRPDQGYPDYYAKMARYIEIISAPVCSLQPGISAQTYHPIVDMEEETVFKYTDTATARAGIQGIADKLVCNKIAIIGLGGTGSYVLDLLAKTPVKEIHLFDSDQFLQHNAFRSPGAPSLDDLIASPKKVDYLSAIYSKMHRNVIPHCENVEEWNIGKLATFDFVFICVDKGRVRKFLIEYLINGRIPFVDAGMGVQIAEGLQQLWGICRVTTGTPQKYDHVSKHIPMQENDVDDLYSQNIQIADLNALNAIMAVMKWKKLMGFYRDDEREFDSIYTTNFNQMTSSEGAGSE